MSSSISKVPGGKVKIFQVYHSGVNQDVGKYTREKTLFTEGIYMFLISFNSYV